MLTRDCTDRPVDCSCTTPSTSGCRRRTWPRSCRRSRTTRRTSYAVSEVSAAVILADKSDVHRSRVRKTGRPEFDIHDRVNFAAEQSFLRVDSIAKTITLELTIDPRSARSWSTSRSSSVACSRRKAADEPGCRFKLVINGAELA